MKKTFFLIFAIPLLFICTSSKNQSAPNNRLELIPEPDENLNAYKPPQTSQLTCVFSDPDTSLSGIKIDDAQSTLDVLGKEIKLRGDTTHFYYSNDKKQVLGLKVHAGSAYSQVSIFTVVYAIDEKKPYGKINVKIFETEKRIKLGMPEKEIIEKLGTCYTVTDSSTSIHELYYRLELPNDSKTKLLERCNMPFYYGKYRFINNKLSLMEFGFEYP
ncbi:MAG TPA: hypothetical protein VFF27_13495 [Bacteroidia bacterium]|nr:hypothetical protein [Bacteroidia bacterium]